MDLRIRRMADRKEAKIAADRLGHAHYRGRHARIQLKPGETAGVPRALAAAVAGRRSRRPPRIPRPCSRWRHLISGGKRVAVVWGGEDAATGQALLELAGALKAAGSLVSVLVPGAQHNSRGAEAMGLLPGYLPGFAAWPRSGAGRQWPRSGAAKQLPAEAGLTPRGILQAAAEGRIEALYLAGANLMNTYPDRRLVRGGPAEGLRGRHRPVPERDRAPGRRGAARGGPRREERVLHRAGRHGADLQGLQAPRGPGAARRRHPGRPGRGRWA